MKKSLIILFLINIILLVVLNIMNFYIFNSVINMFIFNIALFILIIFCIFYQKRTKSIRNNYGILYFTLMCIILFSFSLSMPKYTFRQAQNLILKNEGLSETNLDDKRRMNIKMINSPNFFIGKAYLIYVRDKEVEKVYIFNPIRGEYHLMK